MRRGDAVRGPRRTGWEKGGWRQATHQKPEICHAAHVEVRRVVAFHDRFFEVVKRLEAAARLVAPALEVEPAPLARGLRLPAAEEVQLAVLLRVRLQRSLRLELGFAALAAVVARIAGAEWKEREHLGLHEHGQPGVL